MSVIWSVGKLGELREVGAFGWVETTYLEVHVDTREGEVVASYNYPLGGWMLEKNFAKQYGLDPGPWSDMVVSAK